MTSTAHQRGPGIRLLTPYLAVRDPRAAFAFYAEAFGAVEELRIEEPDGRIGHMTLRLGPALLFLADEHPDFERVVGPETLGGTAVTLDLEHLHGWVLELMPA